MGTKLGVKNRREQFRWWLALRLFKYGTVVAPKGDARQHLMDHLVRWALECRDRHRDRAKAATKTAEAMEKKETPSFEEQSMVGEIMVGVMEPPHGIDPDCVFHQGVKVNEGDLEFGHIHRPGDESARMPASDAAALIEGIRSGRVKLNFSSPQLRRALEERGMSAEQLKEQFIKSAKKSLS